ncbi:MAG TPA: hypothetical protein VFH18_04990 [Erysipelotrichaceae bacterium]|nr:hypothetical protein [Erysipelotrichaceae bacterium]
MKKHSITLFGVPTLFTVLIVVLIISFSTLSYLNTLNIRHSIERGNTLLTESYTIQKDMEILIINIENSLNQEYSAIDDIKDWEYDREKQIIHVSKVSQNLSLNVVLKVINNKQIELEVIEWKLTSGNNQDYTQDGDPVYGG